MQQHSKTMSKAGKAKSTGKQQNVADDNTRSEKRNKNSDTGQERSLQGSQSQRSSKQGYLNRVVQSKQRRGSNATPEKNAAAGSFSPAERTRSRQNLTNISSAKDLHNKAVKEARLSRDDEDEPDVFDAEDDVENEHIRPAKRRLSNVMHSDEEPDEVDTSSAVKHSSSKTPTKTAQQRKKAKVSHINAVQFISNVLFSRPLRFSNKKVPLRTTPLLYRDLRL